MFPTPARRATSSPLRIVVLEKAAGAGAHVPSGAVLEPSALDALLPDWRTSAFHSEYAQPVTSSGMQSKLTMERRKIPRGRSQEDLSDVRCGADDDSAINHPLQEEEEAFQGSVDSATLNQSLLLLAQVGEAANLGVLEGACSSPGIPNHLVYINMLQDSRGVVYLLLDTCHTASSKKTEFMALAEDVGALAMAVTGQVEEYKDGISADTELLEQISRLELEAVHLILKVRAAPSTAFAATGLNMYLDGQNLFKRGSFTWFTKSPKNEVILQRLQRSMKQNVDLFSVSPRAFFSLA
ncbi:hypothetical protein C8J57DRAFT_1519536 [Mycena rebaudengoi]|nr:hypothetical protein C8J57DRAFT_1519536 [Mycena rebaudengoi]